MPACTILRIASGTSSAARFWTVKPGGGLCLGSEKEAQFFVCHSEVADLSCLIQHLQSGAFVEQGDDRKLKLTLSSASAAVFSKLRAYSQDVEKRVLADAVWLRAATGGIVCSSSQGDLAVAVNATDDLHSGHCSFRFLEADPNSLLMKGFASHTATSCQAHQPDALDISLRLHYPPAPVSIGAKPLSPHFANRSSAMPIGLRRPIRKVSFGDLTTLDHSAGSDSKPAPLQTSLPSRSDSFSTSYTLKDAFSDCIPTSPGYSLHSEGSETDESKVRGGHLFDSEDQVSSSDSLSQLDQAFSGLADSSTASPPQTSAAGQHEQQFVSSTSSEQPQQPQQQSLGNASQRRAARLSSDENDEKPSRGTTTHGGNLYLLADANKSSMRSTRSTSALDLIPTNFSHSAAHRAINGHRTHGSRTALSFLSGGCTPSSPHRIPRAAGQPLDLIQSAPVVGAGLLTDDDSHSSHGKGHSQHASLALLRSINSPQKAWGRGKGCCDNSEALAGLRSSRVSADSHREPMLPCILEGLPSQDSEATMACPPALEELLSRSSQNCKLQHMTNCDSAAQLSAKVAAVWPQSLFIPPLQFPLSDGSSKGSATVPKGSSEHSKGSAAVLKGSPESPKGSPTSVLDILSSVKGTAPNGKPPVSPTTESASARSDVATRHCYCSDIQSYIRSQHFPPSQYVAGVKRVCSSPEVRGSLSSLHHPTIHKVSPRGSPSNPSPSKRLHTHSSSLDGFPSGSMSVSAEL
ncbi:TPA: hypothetical protein ACH3X1_014377 [Trebouxia sp. C0004]